MEEYAEEMLCLTLKAMRVGAVPCSRYKINMDSISEGIRT